MSSAGEPAILGAGGHARVVIATAREAGWTIREVLADDPARWAGSLPGAPIRGSLASASRVAGSPAEPLG